MNGQVQRKRGMRMKAGLVLATALTLPFWSVALRAATPPTAGTISVEAKGGEDQLGASTMTTFANAVGQAFEAHNFVDLGDPGHAALVVEFSVSREDVGTGRAKGVTGGASAQGGAPNAVGVGVRIPFGTGNSTVVPLQRTRLEVRLHKRGDDSILWQGAAVTVRGAGTKKGMDEAVATDLSEALLRFYPNQPPEAIGVP
jgi:hypothetical protein